MSEQRTYRHDKTGLIGRYDPRVALAHPHLIEVEDDAKPFALPPTSAEAIEGSRKKAQSKKTQRKESVTGNEDRAENASK